MRLFNLYKIKLDKSVIWIYLLVFGSNECFSLSLAPSATTPPCGGIFGPCVPIDGGISLLLLAGAAYGGKKAYDSWKEIQ